MHYMFTKMWLKNVVHFKINVHYKDVTFSRRLSHVSAWKHSFQLLLPKYAMETMLSQHDGRTCRNAVKWLVCERCISKKNCIIHCSMKLSEEKLFTTQLKRTSSLLNLKYLLRWSENRMDDYANYKIHNLSWDVANIFLSWNPSKY